MESRSLKSRSGAYAINVVKQIAWAGVYVIIALLILSGQSRAGSLACPTYSRINTYYACTAYVDYQYQWYSGAWTGPSNPAGGFQLGDYRWPSASQSAYHNAPGAIVNTVVFTHVWGGSGGPNATATTYIIPTQPITSVGCPTTVAVGANFTCTPTYSYNAPGGTSAWAAGGMTSVTPGTFKATAPGAKTVTLTQTWGYANQHFNPEYYCYGSPHNYISRLFDKCHYRHADNLHPRGNGR